MKAILSSTLVAGLIIVLTSSVDAGGESLIIVIFAAEG